MTTLKTTAIYTNHVSISGVHGLVGNASYSGGTTGNNLLVYACPAGLEKGSVYEISGTNIATGAHVSFPHCTFNGYEFGKAGVGEFTTTGWQSV